MLCFLGSIELYHAWKFPRGYVIADCICQDGPYLKCLTTFAALNTKKKKIRKINASDQSYSFNQKPVFSLHFKNKVKYSELTNFYIKNTDFGLTISVIRHDKYMQRK